MLRTLSIKNFAVVESISMEFGPGFNVLTGETGAGKSLIVDALYFLLGDRIHADMLRAGEERALVEALFQIPKKSQGLAKLAEWGIPSTDGEILVKREFTRSSGKTRSFLNGEMATASMVAELGDWLIDLHGQHEHQAIFNAGRHRRIIDTHGRLETLREKTADAYRSLSSFISERDKLGGDPREIARRLDLLQFQVQELEASGLEALDEEDLLNRYQKMKHGEKISHQVSEAIQALDEEGDGGATGLFGRAVTRLQDASKLDSELEKMLETARQLQEGLNQFSFDLSKKLDGYSFSESEFEDLSDRIDGLNSLKKKYGESKETILNYLSGIREELKSLLGREDRLAALGKDIESAASVYKNAASKLSAKRLEAGKELAKQVEEALSELGLTHAQMGVQITPQEEAGSPVVEKGKAMSLSPEGWDKVEFLFSANPGESLKPLAKVASGGEASRVMLALKTVLAESDEVPTLVFDEIDTGVGARTAPPVANLLSRLSQSKQILCVSHLAPIAGLGDAHFQVSKAIRGGKTFISLARLSEEARIEEIARMLGGDPVSETSRSHARELYARMRPSR